MFGLQHKEKSCSSFGFFSFLKKNDEKLVYNMFFKMKDPRFKTFYLVSSLISCEQGKAFVEEYDKMFYFLCF
jgi:hypothetical protein